MLGLQIEKSCSGTNFNFRRFPWSLISSMGSTLFCYCLMESMTVSVECSPRECTALCIIVNLGTGRLRSSPSRPGRATQQNPVSKPWRSSINLTPIILWLLFSLSHLTAFSVPTLCFPLRYQNCSSLPSEQCVPAHASPPCGVGPLRWRPHPRLWEHCSSGVSVKVPKQGPGLYMVREKSIRVSDL